MAVTVEMIMDKEFTTVQEGYDPTEVDEFLDDIVDEMDALLEEIDELRNQPAPQAPAPVPVQPAREQVEIQEESLRNILLNAQRVSDDTIADAKKRAQEILLKANQQADTIVSDARAESEQLREEMETLRAAAQDYRARFQRLIEDQEHLLKGEKQLFGD